MNYKILLIALFSFAFTETSEAQCLGETHTPFGNDGWISCQTSPNPNPENPVSHWIMYDLGYEYVLDSTHIWNYNTWGKSTSGVQGLIIDYSINGTDWTSLGTFFVEQASASYKYEGIAGPEFNDAEVRYILLTAVSNWGDPDCTGLAEIKFFVNGTVSDDEIVLEENYMAVMPNPVDDIANVSIKSEVLPESVGLYDLSGRLLQEQNSILSKNVSFSMKGLPGGIYFVKARVGESILTEKVVKVE